MSRTAEEVRRTLEWAEKHKRQYLSLLRKARSICNHTNARVERVRVNSEWDSHAEYKTRTECPDCGYYSSR